LRIGIVGAAGSMGELLTQYFKGKDHSISIYDLDRKRLKALSKREKVSITTKLTQLVSQSDVLVVSVPIEETLGVVREILDSGGKGKCVVEISSVKKGIVPELWKYASSSTRVVSLHLLFGPGARSADGQSIAVIPVKNSRTEKRIAAELFPTANIFVVDADLHDRIIALTITGTFFLNMAWLKAAKEFSWKDIRRHSGPPSKLQSIIAESYLAQDLELYASICRNNVYAIDAARQLAKGIDLIVEKVSGGEKVKNLSPSYVSTVSSRRAYSQLYDLIGSMNG
jgi:prephenate dehydrogenase